MESEDPTAAEALPQETLPIPAMPLGPTAPWRLQVPTRVVLEAWPVRSVPRVLAVMPGAFLCRRAEGWSSRHGRWCPCAELLLRSCLKPAHVQVHVAASFGNRQGANANEPERRVDP